MDEKLNEIKLKLTDNEEEEKTPDLRKKVTIKLGKDPLPKRSSLPVKESTKLLNDYENNEEIKQSHDEENKQSSNPNENEEEEEDEEEEEEDDFDRKESQPTQKTFQQLKEEAEKMKNEEKYQDLVDNLNDYLRNFDKKKGKDRTNESLAEIYKWRAECYQGLNKYIQATYDFQKVLDLGYNENCSRSSKLHFSIRKVFAKHTNDL